MSLKAGVLKISLSQQFPHNTPALSHHCRTELGNWIVMAGLQPEVKTGSDVAMESWPGPGARMTRV